MLLHHDYGQRSRGRVSLLRQSDDVDSRCLSPVTVRTAQPKLLYDSAQWPEGVLVRHYYDRHGSQHM